MSNQYFGDDRIVHETLDISKASRRKIYPDPEVPDDIVALLRKEYDHFNNDGVGDYEVIATAIIEIERLREQVEYLKANIEQLVHEAVRGE